MAEEKKDPLEHMLGKPDEKPTRAQHARFRELIHDEAAKLTGKDRETVMRRIEELEREEDLNDWVGNLRFQIKTRLLDEISNRSREDGNGSHEGHDH